MQNGNTMSESTQDPFSSVPMASRDPILGITEAYNADENQGKVNLGVGVYYDDSGKVPLLKCVQIAEKQILNRATPYAYLPIDGIPLYNLSVQKMVFGAESAAVREERVATVQSLGGTGALRIGADFLKRFSANSQVWISDPSWENHRALFESAGFTVHHYPYYDPKTRGIRFEEMRDEISAIPSGATLLLHACCHNPTGMDLSDGQWDEIIAIVNARGLVPFLDMAYQGFAQNLDEDGEIVRRFAERCPCLLVSNSYSKSFSLYGGRTGAFSLVTHSAETTARALSQIKRIIRTNYSNPPRHGAEIVATVLSSPELYRMWSEELAGMRTRIHLTRQDLSRHLSALCPNHDFSYITEQNGLFSYSGLSREQVKQLRDRYSVYAVDTGRICVAALNSGNVARVAQSIAKVL